MKKLFIFLTMLVLGIVSSWATVLTLTPSNGTYVTSSGNYVNSITFSTTPSVTVTASANNMDKRQTSTYLLWHSGQSGSSTYTITVDNNSKNYFITGFTVTGEANTSAQTLTVGSESHEFAVGTSSSFEVTGLSSYSVSFVQTGANASGLKITSISVSIEEVHATYIYQISDADGVVYTSDKFPRTVGETISTLPSELQRPYCTYTVTPTTIVSGENTVPVTVTYNLPFTVSPDYENATWYYWMQSYQDATKNYISYKEGEAFPTLTSKPESDAGLWAFMGNPYDGFNIINKEAGEGKYLQATSDYPSMTTTSTTWVIGGRNGFDTSYFNVHTGNTNYLNLPNSTLTLKYWNNSSAANDNNSTFRVEEYSEDFTSSVETYISPYFENHGKYFALTKDAYNQYYETWTAAKTNCDKDKYTELSEIVKNKNNIKYPDDGWYLLKNYSTNTYLNTTSSSSVVSSTNNAPSSIVYLDKQDDGTYYIMSQGAYFQTPSIGSNVSRGATPVKFTTEIATAQVVDFKAGSYGLAAYNGYIQGGYLRGIGTDSKSYWTVEDATGFDVAMNGPVVDNYYATLCVPFDVTISNDATAYTLAKSESGNYLVPTEVEGNQVPAGTPVLLKGINTTATATINTGSAFNDGSPLTCALTGTYVAKTIDGNNDYVFGRKDEKVGFYHWDSSNLGANRAYLAAESVAAGARGFALNFDDEATGIVTPSVDTERETTIYNLSGQRLNKVQKGINIVNGKKVLF